MGKQNLQRKNAGNLDSTVLSCLSRQKLASYQNRRADYLKAWWNVVNWTEIGNRYAAARAGTLAF